MRRRSDFILLERTGIAALAAKRLEGARTIEIGGVRDLNGSEVPLPTVNGRRIIDVVLHVSEVPMAILIRAVRAYVTGGGGVSATLREVRM